MKNKSKKKETKIYITNDQFEQIEHYRRMFEMHGDTIRDLCNGEKDDVVYGYELGKLHSYIRDCFSGMLELEQNIREQNKI